MPRTQNPGDSGVLSYLGDFILFLAFVIMVWGLSGGMGAIQALYLYISEIFSNFEP